jgi:hypothetical protein
MALNVNRNLPSFSEMFSAMQNKDSLAEAIKSGYQGYLSGVESTRKGRESEAEIELKSAQAKEALSKANADPMKDYTDIRALAPNLTKEQYDTLAATATPLGDKLMVKKSEVANMIPLVKEQGTERRAELARAEQEKARLAAEKRQLDVIKALSDRQQKALDAANAKQEQAQALQTSQAELKEAEKRPGLMKGVDYFFNTAQQQRIKAAQQIRDRALRLQPGETEMVGPDGIVIAVQPEEIAEYMQKGYHQR